MDSYGDGNVYRGQVCKDPEIKTIEINRYSADVERLVEAAREVADAVFPSPMYAKLKAALEPFKDALSAEKSLT